MSGVSETALVCPVCSGRGKFAVGAWTQPEGYHCTTCEGAGFLPEDYPFRQYKANFDPNAPNDGDVIRFGDYRWRWWASRNRWERAGRGSQR